jgi:hypothetical protein
MWGPNDETRYIARMARVREIFNDPGSGRAHPTEVECGWQVVHCGDGSKFLQLSTYGSDQRKSDKKVSQTIQFDKHSAKQLVDILRTTFDL